MRATISLGFLLLSATAALAGEERGSAAFERLSRQASKIFVGRVHGVQRFDDERGKFKIVSLETLEAWKGVSQGEIVRVLAFDHVAHAGDPEMAAAQESLLAYLSPAPAKPAFRKFGEGLFLPAGGESSMISLDGDDAAELMAAARAGFESPASVSLLLSQIEHGSERLRERALASLAGRPAQDLAPVASRLAARLASESQPAMQADLVQLLGKSGAQAALDPLIEYAIESPQALEAVPLVAAALNAIDASQAARKIESLSLANENVSARALALLGRIESPEALRVLLERARAARPQMSPNVDPRSRAISIESPATLLATGSLEEKQLSAFQLFRWGSREEKMLVRDEAKRTTDPALRRFLEKLLREPFRPYQELR